MKLRTLIILCYLIISACSSESEIDSDGVPKIDIKYKESGGQQIPVIDLNNIKVDGLQITANVFLNKYCATSISISNNTCRVILQQQSIEAVLQRYSNTNQKGLHQ